jgi:hypothetical protein
MTSVLEAENMVSCHAEIIPVSCLAGYQNVGQKSSVGALYMRLTRCQEVDRYNDIDNDKEKEQSIFGLDI